MQARIAEAIGAKDASIFDAHLLVVEDRTLIDEVLRTLERDRRNIEADLRAGGRPLRAGCSSRWTIPYLRERRWTCTT